jgi:hypothetical protein
MSDYTIPKQDTMVQTLEDLAVAREYLHSKGFITNAEYNHLYVLRQDIVDLMGMAMRWTVHLQAETYRKEERGEREDACNAATS